MKVRKLALGGLALEAAFVLAGHSRLGRAFPFNAANEDAHLVELLVAALLIALALSPAFGRVVRTGGHEGESLFASFRRAHPLLKLSFSFTLVAVAALGVEGTSALILRFEYGVAGPRFRQDLSGYRVFKENPGLADPSVIGEPGATHVPDRWGLVCDHEVALEKPPGRLRVFMTGGSALAGAGQVGLAYGKIHAYPVGVYSYRASLPGAVAEALRRQIPGLDVEVVNAAYYQKSFHQSFVHYLESLSRFHPDYVVNVDGFNDQRYFGGEVVRDENGVERVDDAWAAWESRFLEPFVALHQQGRGDPGVSRTRRLVTLLIERAHQGDVATGGTGPPRTEARIRQDYDAARERLVHGAGRWLETYGQYLAVLAHDHVRCVFAIQPILARAGGNKRLSAIETAFDAIAIPRADAPSDQSEGFASARHFLDDYLSAELRRRAAAEGQVYCDLGDEIRPLGSDTELYTDYCHLTPDGNRILGEVLAAKIAADRAHAGH